MKPGQNNISYQGGQVPKPEESGWIVRMAPNIRREDGTVPPVDVIHLHHGVWLNMSRKDMTRPGLPERFMAAGEEKTIFTAPDGYGYRFEKTDKWLINYMLHNLWPKGEKIWITYTLDFIPDTAPQAADIEAATPLWMDVENGSTYPVFDVLKGTGEDGRFTYPDDAEKPYGDDPPDNRFTVPADGTLVATGGHLHPGGIQTDLWVERAGASGSSDVTTKEGRDDTAHLFTSVAKYYEPAGAVSWDVSMYVTPGDYGVALKKGDVLETTATYDSERASWYESMGIMLSWFVPGGTGGDDPFATPVDVKGVLTHGHLAENDNHGGAPNPKDYSDLTDLPVRAGTRGRADRELRVRPRRHVGGEQRPDREGRRHDHVRQQHRRAARERDLAHDHLVQGAVQQVHRHRLPARRRRPGVRLRGARRQGAADGRSPHLEHALGPPGRHLHLLLPDPPVHAGRVPGRRVADLDGRSGQDLRPRRPRGRARRRRCAVVVLPPGRRARGGDARAERLRDQRRAGHGERARGRCVPARSRRASSATASRSCSAARPSRRPRSGARLTSPVR